MAGAARVIWWAIVGVWDETLTLLKANVAWFLVSLPLGLPLLVVIAMITPATDEQGEPSLALALMLTGLLLLIVPNPASLGLHALAATMHRKESPPWRVFWQTTRRNIRLGLALYAIGLLGLVVLGVNAVFYLRVEPGPLQALSLLWLYLGLFWLALQLYLGPLVVLVQERRLLGLYRRAAVLVVAHPIYTLTLLLAIAFLLLICLIVVPLFPGLAMAFVALMTTRALGQLKQKYDPEPSPDEEPA